MDEHHHGGSCCSCEGHAADPGQMEPPPTDIASRSLSDALRLSFRILSLIMVAVLLAFLASGIYFVDSQEVAVLKVFGRVTGTSRASGGLTYTWPYPIGQVDLVRVEERTLEVKDFWVGEGMGDATKEDLASRSTMIMGLRPAVDGALFTGDRNLIHARIICKYRIENALSYFQKVAYNDADHPYDKAKDPTLDEFIRSAICNACIRVSAGRTAEAIKKQKGDFDAEVLRFAQQQLNRMLPVPPGESETVRLISVSSTKVDWPIRAQGAYGSAQQAKVDYEAKRNQAIREAQKTLNSAAGEAFTKLVGVPWSPRAWNPSEEYDLIGQYIQARKDLEDARQASPARSAELLKKAEAVLARIDQVLMSNELKGQAAGVIADARTWQATYIGGVRSRERAFSQMVQQYESSPRLVLERTWADVRDSILQSKLIEKMYVTFGDKPTIIQIKRDPEITKKVTQEQLKADKEQQDQDKDKDQGPR